MSERPDPDPTSMRSRYNRFIKEHDLLWELGMGVLALVYVALPFLAEGPLISLSSLLAVLEAILTVAFLLEFASRLAASRDRIKYLSRHWIDAVALIPVVRGLRVARLFRLGRLVRTFAGLQRASAEWRRLAPYQTVFNLVMAWLTTMLVSALTFYSAEIGVNPEVHDGWDALWWSITTITGGPAEVRSVTEEGRIATGVLLILGVALFAAITASLINLVAGGQDNQHVRSRLRQIVDEHDSRELSDEAYHRQLRQLSEGPSERPEGPDDESSS